jgi:hypothetical protein
MKTQLHISYLGLVRNVIGRSEEDLDVLAGTTVGQLLRLLGDKNGNLFKQSVGANHRREKSPPAAGGQRSGAVGVLRRQLTGT